MLGRRQTSDLLPRLTGRLLKDVFRAKYYNARILAPTVGNISAPREGFTMAQNYAKALGTRLRAIRQQQGLSLQGVEEKSEGRWKAVVVGSYERGDRAVTVQRLSELADFYGIPMSELLPGGNQFGAAREAPPKLVLDLERLHQVDVAEAAPLSRFASTIQAQRGDYNGKVLSIRQEDLLTLAVIYDEPPSQLAERLINWGVLRPSPLSTFDD
jgi:transcriptional regulator with XRE-family HTH domain